MSSPELLLKQEMNNVASLDSNNAKHSFDDVPLSTSQEEALSNYFVACQQFLGSASSSSTPCHWHNEVEILHCLSGQGFVHISQHKSITFNAPAILIIPGKLIHRTSYPHNCKVNRIKLSLKQLQFSCEDLALKDSIALFHQGELSTCLLFTEDMASFSQLNALLLDLAKTVNTTSAYFAKKVITTKSNRVTKLELFDPNEVAEILEKELDDTHAQESQADGLEHSDNEFEELTDEIDDEEFEDDDLEDGQEEQDEEEELEAQIANKAQPEVSVTVLPPLSDVSLDCSFGEPQPDDLFETERLTHELVINALQVSAVSTNEIVPSFTHSDNFSPLQREIASTTLHIKALIFQLLALIYNDPHLDEVIEHERRTNVNRDTIDKVKQLLNYIHENYNKQLTITAMARRMDVSNQYFCRFFKILTELSFLDYLNNIRLQKSAIDLLATTDTVRAISFRHGFDTIGYFFRLFKNKYGVTPLQYRRQFLDELEAQERALLGTQFFISEEDPKKKRSRKCAKGVIDEEHQVANLAFKDDDKADAKSKSKVKSKAKGSKAKDSKAPAVKAKTKATKVKAASSTSKAALKKLPKE